MDKNVWFLFRDDGSELTIKIKNGLLKCNQDLTKEEINFFTFNLSSNSYY